MVRFIFITCIILQATIMHSQNIYETKNINTTWLLEQMKKDSFFAPFLAKNNGYRIQIIYTQINRNEGNQPSFNNYSFQLNDANYFYPASTVKFPISVMALLKLQELQKKIPKLNLYTPLVTDAGGYNQDAVYNDATSPTGSPSIAHYIKKILLVSDNDASNRLYEFLGQQYLNSTLQAKNYKNVELRHRLSVPNFTLNDNKYTNPYSFLGTNGEPIYTSNLQKSEYQFTARNTAIGTGYMQGNKLVPKPFDFSTKNALPLRALHTVLQQVIFPDSTSANYLGLDSLHRNYLLTNMSKLPSESKYPTYGPEENYDDYCKFLLYGSAKNTIPKNIRIFNKVGDAYGFLIDAAYIVDFDAKVEFMLSATIHVNKDGVFNDDKYEYETEGFPFMKKLGELIYKYELARPKKVLPNLDEFRFDYGE